MGRIKKLELASDALSILENAYKTHPSHLFRKRCHIILLKTKVYSSKMIGQILSMEEKTVNSWISKYLILGLEGLKQKKGQGRKAILQEKDLAAVKLAVQEHRQTVDKARLEWEEQQGQKVGKQAFKNFLKNMVADINV